MPRKALFQSPKARSAAIAVVMLFVLVCTLGLAMWRFGGSKTLGWNGLVFDIPGHWIWQNEAPGTVRRCSPLGRQFFDGQVLVMTVTPLVPVDPDKVTEPQTILRSIVKCRYGQPTPDRKALDVVLFDVQAFEHGDLVGAYAAVVAQEHAGVAVAHRVAVVTDNNKRYWYFDLPLAQPAHQIDASAGIEGVHLPDRAFNRVLQSLRVGEIESD